MAPKRSASYFWVLWAREFLQGAIPKQLLRRAQEAGHVSDIGIGGRGGKGRGVQPDLGLSLNRGTQWNPCSCLKQATQRGFLKKLHTHVTQWIFGSESLLGRAPTDVHGPEMREGRRAAKPPSLLVNTDQAGSRGPQEKHPRHGALFRFARNPLP